MSNKKDTLQAIAKRLNGHPFVTPRFLQNTHVQMLLSAVTPYYHQDIAQKERRYIKLTDGSQLAADPGLT